ncbi:Hypothetical protein SPCCCB_spr0787 [Streptococcus pneumoniae CCCB]|uniref:Uncharacterized protein n=1 Tax=Streptococcus pneumoniae (strain ATCC BAA-255 / R6) TaxID=171101 RepID=Q8CYX5_STRR6|nr:Hypothetical protein spr0787 [Streptococcus pneumoniae R6]EDK71893.1 hypothetical protein CGSSp19BS75_03992 [Streptococcus pneumoniae SP19-BS75]EDK77065.1 hypothetical protein CGSSp6BS73_05770 [Streptococcus pneumoniae SP6-BS73]EDK80328.1 hypothetical protein CGSSp23BS72_01722 [Streptococcus pneumoniae SP23-BS72]OLV90586.1 Hypothetical protein SPCCCB_spr0787 [Streptococcus pneumoniae CCCB]
MFTPPFPVMGDIMSPFSKPGWNLFLVKGFFELVKGWQTILFPGSKPRTQHNLCLTVTVNKPAVVLVPNIIYWRVLVNSIIVVVITDKETCVVNTTESNHFGKDIWMLEEEIECMIGSHRATCRHHAIKPTCLVLDKRMASSIT